KSQAILFLYPSVPVGPMAIQRFQPMASLRKGAGHHKGGIVQIGDLPREREATVARMTVAVLRFCAGRICHGLRSIQPEELSLPRAGNIELKSVPRAGEVQNQASRQ